MRDLTKQEIEEYFAYAKKTGMNFTDDEAKLIAETIVESGLYTHLKKLANELCKEGSSVSVAILGIMVRLFQMGRECESTLHMNGNRICRSRRNSSHSTGTSGAQ